MTNTLWLIKDPPRSQLSFDYGKTLISSVWRILNFKMDTSGVISTTFNASESFLVHVSLEGVSHLASLEATDDETTDRGAEEFQ